MGRTPKPPRITIQESETGMVCRAGSINTSLFNFFIEKKKEYKDGTARYDIGVELANNPKKSWRLDSVRGNRTAANKRLDKILANGL